MPQCTRLRASPRGELVRPGQLVAHLGRYPEAVASDREALERKPRGASAEKNLAPVRELIPEDEEAEEALNRKPDEIQFDKRKKGEKAQMNPEKDQAEVWTRNIQTSPRQLLAHRFGIEAWRGKASKP
jgi:Ca-activated chloride channel family protein